MVTVYNHVINLATSTPINVNVRNRNNYRRELHLYRSLRGFPCEIKSKKKRNSVISTGANKGALKIPPKISKAPKTLSNFSSSYIKYHHNL